LIFLNLCDLCQKKGSTIKKGLVVKPILSSEMISRYQVDLIDMQAQTQIINILCLSLVFYFKMSNIN